jgi:hypothetical protein
MGVFVRRRRATPSAFRAGTQLPVGPDRGVVRGLATYGLTWGAPTLAECGPDHWLALDEAVNRSGIVSGRCDILATLHRIAHPTPTTSPIAVTLDGNPIANLPRDVAEHYAAVFDHAGVVDVQVSGLIVWSPDDRVPEYGVQVFACDPAHILPVNRPASIPTMRANSWCASVARTLQGHEAARLLELFREHDVVLCDGGVSVWGSAIALNRRIVTISLFDSPVTTGSSEDFAAAVLRTADGRTEVTVNVEATVSLLDIGPQLRIFYPIRWARPRPPGQQSTIGRAGPWTDGERR